MANCTAFPRDLETEGHVMVYVTLFVRLLGQAIRYGHTSGMSQNEFLDLKTWQNKTNKNIAVGHI